MDHHIEFKHPPVVETVLGVLFKPLKGLTGAHLGAFWQEIRHEWPMVQDAPPLQDRIEIFESPFSWQEAPGLAISSRPEIRLQAKKQSEDRMVQIQNCRLHYNWLGHEGQAYPRYGTVKPEFDGMLARFIGFLSDMDFEELVPKQWEITYVNHIPRDSLWSDVSECAAIFRGLPFTTASPEMTKLETFGGHWHFEIPEQRGRLHVEVAHGATPKQSRGKRPEIMTVKLTARGPIASGTDTVEAVGDGLDLGHEVIITSFRDITSERAHEFWNRDDDKGH